jgi:predicted acetyltransferase
MPQVEIRSITGPELLDISIMLRGYAFWGTPPLPPSSEMEDELSADTGSTNLALFEDGQPQAVVAYMPMTQQVRGQILKVAGVWGVATHPAGRRQGYARQTLLELFRSMRRDEMPFTILYPFRESFYERLGYVTFPQPHKVRFPVNGLTGLLKRGYGGKVELLSYQAGFEQWRAYLKEVQTRMPGMALVNEAIANKMVSKQNYWLAIARVNGQVEGAMAYQLKGYHGDMVVSRFYYHTAQGLYLLLEWLARHADQAAHVELKLPPGELPETWLADLGVELGSYDPPMARVLDLGRVNEAGLQVGQGRFTARILDPQCPWNDGVFTFEEKEGRLSVTPGKKADCELSIQALSGLIYGTHRPEVFALRGWGNPNPETQAAMKSLFPPLLPYLHEVF